MSPYLLLMGAWLEWPNKLPTVVFVHWIVILKFIVKIKEK